MYVHIIYFIFTEIKEKLSFNQSHYICNENSGSVNITLLLRPGLKYNFKVKIVSDLAFHKGESIHT